MSLVSTINTESHQDLPLSFFSQIRALSPPYLWLPQCPDISNDFSPQNYSCLRRIPINVSVLQISGQEPLEELIHSVIEFLSVTATYTLPTHLMNNEWAPYTTYSSPTLLFWPGSHNSEESIKKNTQSWSLSAPKNVCIYYTSSCGSNGIFFLILICVSQMNNGCFDLIQ